MVRPKLSDLPMYVTPDGRGGFRVRSPFKKGTAQRYRDLGAACEAAKLVAELVERERQARLLDLGRPTIAGLVDRFMADQLEFMPWKKGTYRNNVAKLNRIRKELGHKVIIRTDSIFLNDWLASFCDKADTWMKWRYILILLWKFALFREWATVNSAENIPERSTSLVIESNVKARKPLTVAGYKAIHAAAEPWLRLAMDLSLLTLQGRSEVANMRHTDFRDGYLFVIREKVNTKSDAAFIRIRVTPEIEQLKIRALLLDDTVSPYLVHRAPDVRKPRNHSSRKGTHWTWVLPNYLTNAFAEARNQSGFYAHLTAEEQPSFHEVRGLGSRLFEDRGIAGEAITALMSHADKKTTEIYLKGGAKALRDSDYVAVEAPLTLAEMLK